MILSEYFLPMKKNLIKEIINKLLKEIEEEDVGIGLFSIFSESQEDLEFFKENDRERMLRMLQILSEDSRRHKTILDKIITNLGAKAS